MEIGDKLSGRYLLTDFIGQGGMANVFLAQDLILERQVAVKALRFGLSPTIAIILGTMTGSFGGVIRDILANKLPALFHKEIYATACIAGGTVYFLIDDFVNHNLVVFITIMVVISVRLLSVKYHWELPKF